MKKGSRAAVAVALSATLALGCMGTAWATTFSDVDYSGGWYKSAVQYVSDKGYMTGYAGTSEFGVGKTLTRGEFACLLYKRAGSPAASASANETGMRDIDSPSWYTAAANWAAKNGVITGVETGSGKQFMPNEPVTREMMATILWRLSGSPEAPSTALDAIAGRDAVDSWALPAMRWAADKGVLTGVDTPSGKDLQATRDVLREEAAAMVQRYDGLDSGSKDDPAPNPGDNGQGGSTEPSKPGAGDNQGGNQGGSTGGTTEPTNPEPTPADPAKQDQSAPVIKDFIAKSNNPTGITLMMADSDEYEYSLDGGDWKTANKGQAKEQVGFGKLTPDTKYDIKVRRAGDATHNPSPAVSKTIWTAVEKGSETWKNLASGAYTLEWHGTAYYNGRDYVHNTSGYSTILDRNGKQASSYPYLTYEWVTPKSGAGTGKLIARAGQSSQVVDGGYGELAVDVEYTEAVAFTFHTYYCQDCYNELRNRDQARVKDADGEHYIATYNVFDPAQFPDGTWTNVASNGIADLGYTLKTTWKARNTLANGHVDGKTLGNLKLATYDKVSCPKHGQHDLRLYITGDDETNGPGNNSWMRRGYGYVLSDGTLSTSRPN